MGWYENCCGWCGVCCALVCDADTNNDYSPKATDPNGPKASKNMVAQAHSDSASLSLLPGIYVASYAAKAERAPQDVKLERA